MRIYALSTLLMLLILGCSPQKRLERARVKNEQTTKFLLNKLKENQLRYDWFVAKAKVKFEDPSNDVSFTMQVKQKKDSLSWFVFKKVSVEGARVQIQKDKIEILDRQNGEYSQQSFAFLQQQFQIPLNFADLQQLIVGNPIWLDQLNFSSSQDSFYYRLKGKNEQIELDLALNPDDYRIQKLNATVGAYTVEAEIGEYQPVDNQQIPHLVDLYLTSPETGRTRFKISYSKIELSAPESVNFEIPEHYKRK